MFIYVTKVKHLLQVIYNWYFKLTRKKTRYFNDKKMINVSGKMENLGPTS